MKEWNEYPLVSHCFTLWSHGSYTQEIPTRFKKDICSAAASNTNNEAVVNVVGLQHVLQNIGAAHVLSFHEIHSIFMEMGNERGEIPTTQMVQLL